jgi:Tol biopolymer transport system component
MQKLMIFVFVLIIASLACAPKTEVQSPEPPTPQPVEIIPPEQPGDEHAIETTTIVTQQPKKIAFVRNFGSYHGLDICTINTDGTDLQIITKGTSEDSHPCWSPDGTKILFESSREWHGLRSIYVMDANGENIKCLTPEMQYCRLPAWSPDGKKIAYCVMQNPAGGPGPLGGGRAFKPDDIYIMDSDGRNKQCLIKGWCPSWLPDSQHVAIIQSQEPCGIQIVDVENLNTKTYRVYGGLRLSESNLNLPTIAVSPDGKSVDLPPVVIPLLKSQSE